MTPLPEAVNYWYVNPEKGARLAGVQRDFQWHLASNVTKKLRVWNQQAMAETRKTEEGV